MLERICLQGGAEGGGTPQPLPSLSIILLLLLQVGVELKEINEARMMCSLCLTVCLSPFVCVFIGREYKILNLLEFNSTRKRMSVVVRDEAGRILVMCKGADR